VDLSVWIGLGINVAVIVVMAVLGLIAVRLISQRILQRTGSAERIRAERRKQLETLIQAVRWIAHVSIVSVAALMLLSNFIDITPLLASAGVAGLAISLGAQSLIKDFIGGLLILLEGQYVVGDLIQVGNVSGTVERLTLRTTHVRDLSGKLYIVPNGEVRIVANGNRDWARAMVDIGVAYEENLDRVLDVLKGVTEDFAEDADYGPQLLERPSVLGPLSLGDWALTVRVMVKTRTGKQWGVARELRKRILAACDREHITLPYPRQEVWVRDADSTT
jgi:small conductance mechanosensitive channel